MHFLAGLAALAHAIAHGAWYTPVTITVGYLAGFILVSCGLGLGLGWLWWADLSGFWLRHARALCERTGELADEVQQRETHAAVLLAQVQAIAEAVDQRARQARDDFEYRAAVEAKGEVGRLLFGEDGGDGDGDDGKGAGA